MDAEAIQQIIEAAQRALAETLPDRRERIATAVLAGLVTADLAHGVSWSGNVTMDDACVREAVAYADALIAELDRKP